MKPLKIIIYFAFAYFLIRLINHFFLSRNKKKTQTKTDSRNVDTHDKPKFTIEAESVDYEVIDETKEKDEK